MSGFLVKIPTSKTPAMFNIFSRKIFGFLIVPKSQSSITLPFSVTNGYPRSNVRIAGTPPIFKIFLVTILLADGCTSTGIALSL